jgi:hypothetical protein
MRNVPFGGTGADRAIVIEDERPVILASARLAIAQFVRIEFARNRRLVAE